jgi:hypothetical protein
MIRFASASGSGDLGMADSEDTWPLPDYNPGSRLHLHALGVIAVQFAQFERTLEALYSSGARREKMPEALIDLYYFSLNEEKRIEAIRALFNTYEKNPMAKAYVENLLDYFQWCRNCRNQILHAEPYPAMFGGNPDTLYLTKRVGKQSPKSGYMKFKLPQLRSIADKIRAGVVQSAILNLHLRYRDQSLDAIPARFQAYKREPLPQILHVPRHLKLSPKP